MDKLFHFLSFYTELHGESMVEIRLYYRFFPFIDNVRLTKVAHFRQKDAMLIISPIRLNFIVQLSDKFLRYRFYNICDLTKSKNLARLSGLFQ